MTDRRLGKADVFGWAALLALVWLVYRGTLAGLYLRWETDASYGHGVLVPFVSLYFLFEGLRRHRDMEVGGSLWGAAGLTAALAAFFAGRLGNMLSLQAAAFIATLAALAVLVEGWGFLKVAALPVLYLAFICPPPGGLYDSISAHLRLFASAASTVLLQAAGVPATASGNVIYIPNQTLSVDDACSGIRSLFGILATATAFAFVAPGGWIRRTVLILSVAPIAVFSNILRVTGTGLLQNAGYSGAAQGFYHQVEGWMFYVIALAMLFVEYAVLKAVFPIPSDKADEAAQAGGSKEASA